MVKDERPVPSNQNVNTTTTTGPKPKFPASVTGGVIPMGLASRFANERARLTPEFTEVWRKWRIQYIKDQELHPSEPRTVPQLYREFNNPIRRMYKAPMNWVESKLLLPVLGASKANITRRFVTKLAMGYIVVCAIFYHFKYTPATWEKRGGWHVYSSRPAFYPGDHRYPFVEPTAREKRFNDLGFSERKALLNIE